MAQWNQTEPIANVQSNATGFGFIVQGDDSPVRISDVIVSEWNGMPDSARSMQIDDQDVVLMTNGTDRYAGHVIRLDDTHQMVFENKHGSFHFPLQDIAEVRFAHNSLSKASDTPANNIVIRYSPIGTISGSPLSSDGKTFSISHPIIGPLHLSIESAVMLDFNSSNQLIDDWDADF